MPLSSPVMSLDHKISEVRALLDSVQRDYAPATFACSFGAEDMVLMDLIAQHYPGITVFTLDTGRLPEETYSLMRDVADRYGIHVPVYFPESAAVEAYVAQNGPNGFYDSVDLRKKCCHIRKVEPLKRALRAHFTACSTPRPRRSSPPGATVGSFVVSTYSPPT